MNAEKVAARYDVHSNSVSGVIIPPPPPHPHPHGHTPLSKVGKYGMISQKQFYFHILYLNLPPGAISQELARSIWRQLWLDSIAKWLVILLNKNNYPPGLLSMF